MRLTTKGIRIIIALIVLASITIIFKDLVIFIAILLLLSILTLDFLKFKIKIKLLNQSKIEPKEIYFKMVAGENKKIQLEFEPPIKEKVEPLNVEKWIKINIKNSKIYLDINPQVAGEYSLKSLKWEILSPFKFYTDSIETLFNLKVKVYPRVLP